MCDVCSLLRSLRPRKLLLYYTERTAHCSTGVRGESAPGCAGCGSNYLEMNTSVEGNQGNEELQTTPATMGGKSSRLSGSSGQTDRQIDRKANRRARQAERQKTQAGKRADRHNRADRQAMYQIDIPTGRQTDRLTDRNRDKHEKKKRNSCLTTPVATGEHGPSETL